MSIILENVLARFVEEVEKGKTELHDAGKTLVVEMAVVALLKSLPDQAQGAFAKEFERFWQLLGSQHSDPSIDPEFRDGIATMLEFLEEACPALAVRPPRE